MQHYIFYRNKAVLDQLKDGLGCLEVSKALSEHGDILKPLFVDGLRPPLTAGAFKKSNGDCGSL